MAIGQARATLDDLMRTEGKAELIGGRIVRFMGTGFKPNQVAGNIYSELRAHVKRTRIGYACTDNLGFAITELPSQRESFSPDVAFLAGPPPADAMNFVEGPPTFAVEVRSKGDYGKRAEAQIAAKRADYFAAGTLVVWDVDPDTEEIRSYRSDTPDRPTLYLRGDTADAEPAVPGWRVAVDEIFAL